MYVKKLDNLDEMHKFLKINNLLRLNLEEIENLSRTITSKKIITQNLPTKKRPGPDGLTGDFHQIFKIELTPVLKLFQNIEEKGTLPNAFHESQHHLDTKARQKQDKKITDQYLL